MRIAIVGLAAALALLALRPAQAQMFNPESFTLSNGLQVVLAGNHRAPAVAVMLYYKVGADDEVPGKTGLAHMVEHMMFQGTTDVPPDEFSRRIAAVGGEDNAFTTADYTAFTETIGSDHLDLVLRLEADRMANLDPRPAQFATEHQAVLEELRMRVDDSPDAMLYQQMEAALFLNSPYHHPVIGWRSEVEGLTIEDVRAFYRRWYAPNDAVLAVSGNVTAAAFRPLVERYFGPIASKVLPPRPQLEEPVPIASRIVELRDPNVHQPDWSRLYLAPSYVQGDRYMVYPLQLLAEIIGSGTTSRLYRGLVVDRKVAVDASADYDPEARSLGVFSLYATPAPGVGLDALDAAMDDEVQGILVNGVTPEEVARAKARIAIRLAYMRDSYQAGARTLGPALASGETVAEVEQWPQHIAAVTADQVNAAAHAVLRDERGVTGRLLPATAATATTAERPSTGAPPSAADLGKQMR